MKRKRRKPVAGPVELLAGAAKRVLAGDLAGAREACDAVLAAHPTRTDALELRCIVALEEADWGTARAVIERALAEEETAKRHVARAKALIGLGELDEAADALRRALRRDPEDPTIYEVEARLEAARGDLEAALEASRGAVALDPHRVESQAAVGRALLALDRGDEAVEALTLAVRARDGDRRARRAVLEELSALHAARGEDELAEATRALAAQLG